ncbi:DNA polymerase III, subunit gamma and tau [Candidatus Gottesmanbacteria bacterium RBG_16_37_8]|uniref:DNA polymerase III subunit gamma/tau n=1 Tax=Candidatus Gottesmanbacteria bacterium RBG_16_37_8 TaxID=1798371 RepID=A0A1F5YT27_9BACT|nr:MAG: DNA polymerase III, subunit gamma and tau [Candidatus Gottesmanbacteria bacterium RBG_16_37_8]
MVLYRKYRPQKLKELDLSDVREKLVRTLLSSYKPHAYLFSGPKGTGKTSAARIVAKILNCEKIAKTTIEPCDKCDQCQAIIEGRHLDIIEIDAASNRGIDEIRDLKEKIKLAPVLAKYKVYIIDEVHMLTNDAFNALLKTLEEPPAHAVFILATTEADKLPETIVSRSTKFDFHRASLEELLHALKRVVIGEKFKIEDEALAIIAKNSDGSFRDATKILENAINQKATTFQAISAILGTDSISPEKFLLYLQQNKVTDLLSAIVNMEEKGADFRLFIASILDLLHGILLDMHQVKQAHLSKDLKDIFSLKELNKLIKLFSDAYVQMRFAGRPDLPLEIAIIEWSENLNKEVKS